MCNDMCVKYYKGAHQFICQLDKQRSKKTTVTPAAWEDREEGLKRGRSFLPPDTWSSQKAHGTWLDGIHLAPLLLHLRLPCRGRVGPSFPKVHLLRGSRIHQGRTPGGGVWKERT